MEKEQPICFPFLNALSLSEEQTVSRDLLRNMETMENPVLEPRSERIARYKAERRRELAERYGNLEELPSKCVRRDGREVSDPAAHTHKGTTLNSDGTPALGEGVNGRTRRVTNGFEADALAESACLRR